MKDLIRRKSKKQPPSSEAEQYLVLVADNYHIPDESACDEEGRFSTLKEAVTVCRKIVDDFLREACKPGITSSELYQQFAGFGESPWIVPASKDLFDAQEYASQRCLELCREEDEARRHLRIHQLPAELASLTPVIEVALRRKPLSAEQEKALDMYKSAIIGIPKSMPRQSFVFLIDLIKETNVKVGERRHWFCADLNPSGFFFHWRSDTFHQCDVPEHRDWALHSCNHVDHVFWRIYFYGTGRLDRQIGSLNEMMEQMKKRLAGDENEMIVYSQPRDRGLDWQSEPKPPTGYESIILPPNPRAGFCRRQSS